MIHICEEKELEDEGLLLDIVKHSVRKIWNGNKNKNDIVAFGEPDFKKFSSMQFLEHYFDDAFGPSSSSSPELSTPSTLEMQGMRKEQECMGCESLMSKGRDSLYRISDSDDEFMVRMKRKLQTMLEHEEKVDKEAKEEKKTKEAE